MYETASIRLSVPLMTNNSELTNTQPFGWTDEEKQELIVEIKDNWMLTIRRKDYSDKTLQCVADKGERKVNMNRGTLTIECRNMTESVPLESHHVFTPHEILLLKLRNNGLEILKETTRREAVLIHIRNKCNNTNQEFTWFKSTNSLTLLGLKTNKKYHLRISVESQVKWSCVFNDYLELKEHANINWLTWQAVGKGICKEKEKSTC